MPLEKSGSNDTTSASAEGRALERATQQQQTQAELTDLGDSIETESRAETPTQRAERLGDFVEANFAEVCPAEFRDSGIAVCQADEDECREMFEEPDLQLAPEDAEDPELIGKIEDAVAIEQAKQAVATNTESRDTKLSLESEQTDSVVANDSEIADEEAVQSELQIKVTQNDKTIETNDRDIATLKQTQARFAELKAEHGGDTIVALRSLLASDQLQSPEIREYLQNTITTAEALRTALPGKEAVVTQLLNASALDLTAGGGAATFADFMTALDASDELTAADKTKLRTVLHGPAEVQTGSDIKAAFAQGRGVVTKPNGTTEAIAYDEDHPVKLAAGISVYPDGHLIRGTAKIAGRSFPFRASANISGSALTEQLNCHAALAIKESAGVTGGTQQGFEANQGTKELDLSGELFETQAVRFGKLTYENLIDGFDASSRLISEVQVRQMQWGFQWLMPQRDALGDGGYGDNNKTARMAALGGGGNDGLIWDGNDNLNEDNYRLACQFIRDQGRTGASEPDFGALVVYLEGVNGAAEAA